MRFPVLFLACCFLFSANAAGNDLPNIVLLVADDLGYGELGCQGNPEIPTPHIDSIANDGVRFTNGYVTAAFCSASRAGLMTGRYQTRFGYEFNPIGAQNEDPDAGLPVSEKTIADVLVNQGYYTGIFGKWHLGGTAKYNPIRRGFDEWFGFLHEGHYFVPQPYDGVTTWLRRKVLPGGHKDGGEHDGTWSSKDGKLIFTMHMGNTEPDYDADNPIFKDGQPVEENEYLTDAFTREAVSFIDRHADKPFFLYLPYNAVHSPMQGADDYMKKFAHIENIQRRIFAAMLANMDDSVGEVLAALEKNKVAENTWVTFISDNGGPTRELTSSNAPLREGKGTVYEGGLRVPFLMKWPGKIPAGETFSDPVISLDIFATAAAVSGARLEPKKKYDGVNLLPFLNGEVKGKPHDELFWRIKNKTAVRVGDWKLLKNPVRQAEGEWELYDLADDIGESKNLAAENPEKLSELRAVWERFNGEMIDPVWSPRKK